MVLEKEILKFHQCNFAILLLISTLEKDVTVHLNKFESPSSKNALCWFLLKLGQWSWKISKVCLCVFAHFLIIFSCKKAWPFFWTKSNTFYIKIPGFVEIGPVVLEKIFKVFNVFSFNLLLSPLEKRLALPLNKLEFPLIQDSKMLCAKFGWIRKFRVRT